MPPEELIVSLVTWNHVDSIAACIESLLHQTFSRFSLHIFDNASQDGTVDTIRQFHDERIKLYTNTSNIGFCGGHNYTINRTTSKYVLLMNPDVLLDENYLDCAVNTFDAADNRVGTICGLLFQDSHLQIIDSAGLIFTRDRRFVLRYHNRSVNTLDLQECRVDGVDGALPFYRRAMIDDLKINGSFFDEAFFSHKEDWDISWRSRLFGWSSLFVPECVAIHPRKFKSQNAALRRKIPDFVKYHAVKNQLLLILKNDTLISFLANAIFIIPRQCMILLYVIFFEKTSLRAYLYPFHNFYAIMNQRKMIFKKVQERCA
jgi:GT2 family glycosyltransferase